MFKSNARILIVDDIMSMRKLAAGSLKSLGYSHFEEASDGQEALHLLNTSKKGFDLIVSD
jgi:two-component system, chemotaxis family, chemotaxis protein CheY